MPVPTPASGHQLPPRAGHPGPFHTGPTVRPSISFQPLSAERCCPAAAYLRRYPSSASPETARSHPDCAAPQTPCGWPVTPSLNKSTISIHYKRSHRLKGWMPQQSKLNIYFLLKHLNEKIKTCFTFNRKAKSNQQRSSLAGT